MSPIMYGVDISKSLFQVHGADASGAVKVRKKLRRSGFLSYFAGLPGARITLEACGGAHHWARELARLGHDVRLIHPQRVKPFVQRNKTDARDAAAICEAASRANARFVAVKSVETQADCALLRARDLLVRQRTALANALRGHLAEVGLVAPKGQAGLHALLTQIDGKAAGVPEAYLPALEPLRRQYAGVCGEITALERTIRQRAGADAAMKRLTRIPGVGPITAFAMVSIGGDAGQFACARDFVAWLGLTPKENQTAGRRKPGAVSKQGDETLRSLFVLGAASSFTRPQSQSDWLKRLRGRRPAKVAMVAQAAKTARIAFAVLRDGAVYDPDHRARREAAPAARHDASGKACGQTAIRAQTLRTGT